MRELARPVYRTRDLGGNSPNNRDNRYDCLSTQEIHKLSKTKYKKKPSSNNDYSHPMSKDEEPVQPKAKEVKYY